MVSLVNTLVMQNNPGVTKLKSKIPIHKDWPKPGVNFIDINGILTDPWAYDFCIEWLKNTVFDHPPTSIVAIESRGFLFGSPIAHFFHIPLVIVRKPNKLPGELKTVSYDTEYSTDSLSIQANAPIGNRPLIVDDLLATGGTIMAVKRLLNVEKVNAAVIVNLSFLPGMNNLSNNGILCDALISYDD